MMEVEGAEEEGLVVVTTEAGRKYCDQDRHINGIQFAQGGNNEVVTGLYGRTLTRIT